MPGPGLPLCPCQALVSSQTCPDLSCHAAPVTTLQPLFWDLFTESVLCKATVPLSIFLALTLLAGGQAEGQLQVPWTGPFRAGGVSPSSLSLTATIKGGLSESWGEIGHVNLSEFLGDCHPRVLKSVSPHQTLCPAAPSAHTQH